LGDLTTVTVSRAALGKLEAFKNPPFAGAPVVKLIGDLRAQLAAPLVPYKENE
jgi:hypothetical protein